MFFPFEEGKDAHQHVMQRLRDDPGRCLMVRDLPYCCDSDMLGNFCGAETKIKPALVYIHYDSCHRTMYYGYLMFATYDEANFVRQILHLKLLHGRNIRVSPFDATPTNEKGQTGEIHVYFRSSKVNKSTPFTANSKVDDITEQTIRNVLETYGIIDHVIIRQHWKQKSGKQEGYGFVTFSDPNVTIIVIQQVKHKCIGNIVYDCTLSTKHIKIVKIPIECYDIAYDKKCYLNFESKTGPLFPDQNQHFHQDIAQHSQLMQNKNPVHTPMLYHSPKQPEALPKLWVPQMSLAVPVRYPSSQIFLPTTIPFPIQSDSVMIHPPPSHGASMCLPARYTDNVILMGVSHPRPQNHHIIQAHYYPHPLSHPLPTEHREFRSSIDQHEQQYQGGIYISRETMRSNLF